MKTKLLRQAAKSRIPILGEFELTSACNFHCKMCYLTDHSKHQLDTITWKRIFDEAVANGLLYALLTGGECFLRPDFIELYEYLYDAGVRITLFTNGSTVTDGIVKTLVARPPELVTITMYGGSDETYEKVTERKRGFTNTKKGIESLLSQNINVSLRTVPLEPIYRDLDAMIAYAKSKDLLLNYVTYITPTKHIKRLDIEELLLFEERIKESNALKSSKLANKDKNQTNCLALKSSYYINSFGDMQMCALAYTPKQSIIQNDFYQTFIDLGDEINQNNNNQTCKRCDIVTTCPTCYARRLYENTNGCNTYLRKYATHHHE